MITLNNIIGYMLTKIYFLSSSNIFLKSLLCKQKLSKIPILKLLNIEQIKKIDYNTVINSNFI